MLNKIEKDLKTLRKQKPLVLNVTNYVTMDFMANSLLALGAAPIMSVLESELEELVSLSSAVNINIGTLDESFIKNFLTAAEAAKQQKKPIILDPVGAGASTIRTQTAIDLLKYVDIVRGNASEIIALSNKAHQTLGVESVNSTSQAKDIANDLAQMHQCIIVVSGVDDFVTDGTKHTQVAYGDPLMAFVTGMGCTLTATIAAFSAVNSDYFDSSLNATTYFGLCGTLAGKKVQNPGGFRTTFIDALHEADFNKMREYYAI